MKKQKVKGNVFTKTLVWCAILLTLFNVGTKIVFYFFPSLSYTMEGKVIMEKEDYKKLTLEAKNNAPKVIEIPVESQDNSVKPPRDMLLAMIQFTSVTSIINDQKVDETKPAILCFVNKSEYTSYIAGLKRSFLAKTLTGEELRLDSHDFLYFTALDPITLQPLK